MPIAGPLDQYAKAMSLKGMMQNQQLQQNQLQMQQQEMNEYRAAREAIQQAGGDIRKALPEIMKVAPNIGLKYQKSISDWEGADVTKKKGMLDLEAAKVKGMGQLAGTITDQGSYENAVKQAAQSGLLERYEAAEMLQMPYDPAKVKAWQMRGMEIEKALGEETRKLDEKIKGETLTKTTAEATMAGQLAELPIEKRFELQRGRQPVPGVDVPYPADVAAQKSEIADEAAARTASRQEAAEKRKAGQLTGSTKTMVEAAPRVKDFIARIRTLVNQQKAQLGPASGRWSEFMTGKVGAPNAEFAKLRTNVGLLQTLLMRMHVGARGGQYIMSHFRDLVDSGKQSPENLLGALGEIDNYADDLIEEGAQAGVGGGGQTGTATHRFNPETGQIEAIR